MLDSDDRAAADEMSASFADGGVPQFWDGKKLLGWEVSRSFGITDHAAWDIYLFYPPDAEWTDAGLPPAEKAIAQARGGVVGINAQIYSQSGGSAGIGFAIPLSMVRVVQSIVTHLEKFSVERAVAACTRARLLRCTPRGSETSSSLHAAWQ